MNIQHVALLVQASLIASCGRTPAQTNAGKPSLASREEPCSVVAQIDTTGWMLDADSAVGLELVLPRRYVHKHWTNVKEPPGVVSADWWRDGGARATIELSVRPVRPDS